MADFVLLLLLARVSELSGTGQDFVLCTKTAEAPGGRVGIFATI